MLDIEEIKRLRKKLGMSQAAAARAAGFNSRQWWQNFESGRKANISMDNLDAIARALKTSPKNLVK